MYFRDKLGSFEIIVDKERRVVHEKLSGLFTCDDSNRLERQYMNNIIPFLGEGKWVKLCDMTEYIPNTSVGHGDIGCYVKRLVPYGFAGGAVVATKEIIRMYLSMAIKDMDTVNFAFFNCEQEADEYLRSLSF